MKYWFWIFIVIFLSDDCYSRRDSDSIRKIIETTTNDSIKTQSYFALIFEYLNTPDKALELTSEFNSFGENLKDERTHALALRKIGAIYHTLGYYDKALDYYIRSVILFEKLHDKKGLTNCYNNIANAYGGKAQLTNDIHFFRKAVEYHQKGIVIRKDVNDTMQLRNSYNNIGLVYMNMRDYEKALEYFNTAIALYEKNPHDRNGITMIKLNLGDAFLRKGIKDKNNEYLQKALSYFKQLEYDTIPLRAQVAIILNNIGAVYIELGELDRGIKYVREGMSVAVTVNDKTSQKESAELLNKAYEKKGDYKSALEYLHLQNSIKDTLMNLKSSNETDQMQVLFHSLQKDNEIEKLNGNKKIQEAELSRNRTVMLAAFGGIFLIIIFTVFLYSRFRVISKQKQIIEIQKQKVEEKNELIEEKQKEIIDSITYAKRIQTALITSEKYIDKSLRKLQDKKT